MADRWYPGWGLAVLRVMLGVIFLAHGADKLFGTGVGAFVEFLEVETFPAAPVLAWGVAGLEFLGGLLLLVGWQTRWWAAALFLEMLVALFAVHVENGFFVFRDRGEWGYEYHLALLGGLGCLFLSGGGKLSVDDWRIRGTPPLAPVE
jgi:putative oxidoreductase